MQRKRLIIQKIEGVIQDQEAFDQFFAEIPETGSFIVEAWEGKKRSNPQNRYYYGMVVPLVRKGLVDLGHDITAVECHEFLKARFNSDELLNEETAEVMYLPRSTTRLTTVEFMDYIAKIQRFCTEFLGFYLPDPGQQTSFNY